MGWSAQPLHSIIHLVAIEVEKPCQKLTARCSAVFVLVITSVRDGATAQKNLNLPDRHDASAIRGSPKAVVSQRLCNGARVERQCLQAIAGGSTALQIAADLKISAGRCISICARRAEN